MRRRTKRLGRYHLTERIAFGGMAEIFRAFTFEDDGFNGDADSSPDTATAGGCSLSQPNAGGTPWAASALALLGVVLLRRRRAWTS